MIDFIKLQTLDNIDFENYLTNHNVVDLRTFIDHNTGEVLDYPKIGKLSNLEVRINPKHSYIKGSLHKFYNILNLNVKQNYNDFYFCQLLFLIEHFFNVFKVEEKNSLSYLEIGVNINLDFNLQKFIDNQLLMYDYKSHNKDLKYRGKGDYKEFIKTDYNIKIYNKSKEYELKDNILRIELKITKKRFLQKNGIFKLEDLLIKNNLSKLFNILINEFDKILIIDYINELNIPQNDIEKLSMYTNPNYWQRIKDIKSYKVQSRHKRDFNFILNKYNLLATKKIIKQKIISKFWQLLNDECENYINSKISA